MQMVRVDGPYFEYTYLIFLVVSCAESVWANSKDVVGHFNDAQFLIGIHCTRHPPSAVKMSSNDSQIAPSRM